MVLDAPLVADASFAERLLPFKPANAATAVSCTSTHSQLESSMACCGNCTSVQSLKRRQSEASSGSSFVKSMVSVKMEIWKNLRPRVEIERMFSFIRYHCGQIAQESTTDRQKRVTTHVTYRVQSC